MSPVRLSGKRSLQERGAVQTSSKLEDGSCVQQRERKPRKPELSAWGRDELIMSES